MAGVGAVEHVSVGRVWQDVAHDGVVDDVSLLVVDGHVREVHLPVLEHALADGALVVLVLEARLLVEVHVRLRGAEVLADAAAHAARQVPRVQRRVVVVLPHVQLVVALESK